MAGIAITRRELTATELRAAAGRTKDARAARRMLAIALVLEGVDRATAAQTCGMDRQTLRDWVHRYNAEGLAGLKNRMVPHRPRRLAPGQLVALAAWVEAGPDPVRDGVVRWRRRDLQHRIKTEFGVMLHECRAGQATGGTRFSAVVRAPAAPEVGPGSARSVQKNFPEAVAAAIPARARDKPLEIWFQEFDMEAAIGPRPMANARVGQQGTLTRIWARRGSRPRAPRDTRYQWAYIFGAVCPARGTAAGLVLPFVNTAAMNAHLAEIARTVAPFVGEMIPQIMS